MDRFILGGEAAFNDLKQRISGRCLRFAKVELPPGADPRFAAIGFETDPRTGLCILYVDRGHFHGRNDEIAAWINTGERRFPSFTQLRMWLQETLPALYFSCPYCEAPIDLAGTLCTTCRARSTVPPFVARAVEVIRKNLDRDPSSITDTVSVTALADHVQLPRPVVRLASALLVSSDQRFLLTTDGTETLIFRNPLAHDRLSQGIVARVRDAFSGQTRQRKDLLRFAELRARLSHQAEATDLDLRRMHSAEERLFEDGRGSPSPTLRREFARRIHQVRCDIARTSAKVAVINRQLDILATHLYHLQIARDVRQVELPASDEIAQQAAEAEQVIQDVNDMVAIIDAARESTTDLDPNRDVDLILREFENPPRCNATSQYQIPTQQAIQFSAEHSPPSGTGTLAERETNDAVPEQ